MSNLLAAVGRGQLAGLHRKVQRRRHVNEKYRLALADQPGLAFMPEAAYGRSNCWLTCVTIDPALFGATTEQVRLHLESLSVEARPLWKPMHLQPVFKDADVRGGAVAARLFEQGLCLPSGSSLSDVEQKFVVDAVEATPVLVADGKTVLAG